MESEKPPRFSILLFPWLAHGHIFPYLELAKRILTRKNFKIHLCTTPINFTSIQIFLEKNSLQNSIELVELHLQSSPELPPHYHTTKNLPSNLNFTLLQAFQTTKSSFSSIIKTLNPDLVLYDIFQPWAAIVASSQGIPCVHFAGFGAATVSVIHHHYSYSDTISNFPFPEICLEPGREKESVDGMINFLAVNVFDGVKDVFFFNLNLSSEIALLKTSRRLEGQYIDYASGESNKKIVPVGPLVQDGGSELDEESSEIMQWLNEKKLYSTVYISFGSECFLSKEEMEEIAKGLEICGVNFIWVIRFPIGVTISVHEALPFGFLDRVKGRGIVVSGWAPQVDILAHKSVGGFVSHCGWSSLTESVYYGVPIIGMPMKLNMFIDAKMLVEAGVCVVVPRNGEDGTFMGDDIGEAINNVFVEKCGQGFRIRARELSQKMKMEEGEESDQAVEQLWKICEKNKHK